MAIAVATLVLAAYEDIKSREIDKFMFVPLVLVGSLGSFFDGMPLPAILFPAVLFASLFVRFVPWLYALIGIAAFAITFYLSPQGYFLELVVVAIIYFLGMGEKLFGIGDIKAMIAISLSFSSPFIYNFIHPSYVQSLFPFDFSFLFSVSILSLVYIIYMLASNVKRGEKVSLLSLFSFRYSKEEFEKNPEKYTRKNVMGKEVMVYGIPFILPIFAGLIMVSALGTWYLL